jgi:hypothetical protein
VFGLKSTLGRSGICIDGAPNEEEFKLMSSNPIRLPGSKSVSRCPLKSHDLGAVKLESELFYELTLTGNCDLGQTMV